MDDMYDYIIFPKKEMGVIDCFSKHLRCLHKRLYNMSRDILCKRSCDYFQKRKVFGFGVFESF